MKIRDESQESCEDAISREALIRYFKLWQGKMIYSFSEDYSGVSILDTIIQVIKDMPSVTAANKRREYK